MEQEYSFTLTIPLDDLPLAQALLEQTKQKNPRVRISRKPDSRDSARYYISFPFSSARPDLTFQKWLTPQMQTGWDLYGPMYGRWGLTS